MQNTEKLLQEFKALNIEDKQNKLLAIFNFAKDKFDFSENAINYLSTNTLPDELVMIKLYEFVLHAISFAEQRIQKEQKEYKEVLKEKSISEQKKDSDDADKLLDLINLL